MSENNNVMDEYSEPQMAATEKDTDKKCPNCGGTMDYDPATRGLKCPFCDYQQEIVVTQGTKNEAVMEQDFSEALDKQSYDWGTTTKTVACKACGAELVYDALQNSEICPYCGSNHVMQVEDGDTMKPGGVVPFKITEKQAAELFKNWIKGKLFCPRDAKDMAKAGKFKGVYLPYWTFDTKTYTDYTGQYGKTHTVRVNKDTTRTEVRWYNTSGHYNAFVNDYPVLATKRHDTAMLKGILPFDTEANKAYEPEFVAGFASERYSIGLKDGWNIAKPEIKNNIKREIENEIRHRYNTAHVRNVSMSTMFDELKYKYLLLPVWNSSYKYNSKVYNFMVNGQTGKVSGKAPISPIRVAIAVIIGIIVLWILSKMFLS